MKAALIILSANLVALGLLGLAAYLIYLQRDGWGWVVFAAMLCHTTPTYASKNSTDKESSEQQ